MRLIYHKTVEVTKEDAEQESYEGLMDTGLIPDVECAILECAGYECIIEVRRGRKLT